MALIRFALDDRGVATITLNRDEKRNALNQAMATEILDCLQRAEQDRARVLVLRANAGVKVWCAGHDLSELRLDALAENPTLQVAEKVQSTPLPVIAMVEGSVHGGGLILLLSADIVIAAPNADVAITSTKMGIPLAPEMLAFWLRVMGLHKIKELLFTAATIAPRDAYHAGLYNHVVDHEQLEQVTEQLASRILASAPESVANTKYQLNLIARRTALAELDEARVREFNRMLTASPATQARIAALLSSLGG